MKVLIADDDPVTCCRLEDSLTQWGYRVETAHDGMWACETLQAPDAPQLAVLDWIMPGMDGLEVCRRVRAARQADPPHLILLTARAGKQNILAGLQSGADDYITKPFDDDELLARLHIAERMLSLQQGLANQVAELKKSLARVKQLHGLLPICSYCKRIRTDQDYWQQVESYVAAHSDAEFTHTFCPSCYEEKVRPDLERFLQSRGSCLGDSGPGLLAPA